MDRESRGQGPAHDTTDGGGTSCSSCGLTRVLLVQDWPTSAGLSRGLAGRSLLVPVRRRWPDLAAHCVHGSTLLFSGNTHEAQAAFQQAVQVADNVGDRRARIYALGYLAMISAEHGQHADAELYIRRASGGGRDLGDAEHLVDVMVSLATAELLAKRGDTAAAAAAADMAVMSARQGRAILKVAKTLLVRADIFEYLGDHQSGKAILEEVRTLVRGCADAAIASTLRASLKPSANVAVTSRNEGCAVGEEL